MRALQERPGHKRIDWECREWGGVGSISCTQDYPDECDDCGAEVDVLWEGWPDGGFTVRTSEPTDDL